MAVIASRSAAVDHASNLARRAGLRALARAVLYPLLTLTMTTLATTTAGCVIPTKLEEQPAMLDQPTILSAKPAFGVLAPGSGTQTNLFISVEDQSPLVKRIYVRLLKGLADGTLFYPGTATNDLLATDPDQRTVFSGEILQNPDGLDLCTAYNVTGELELFVYVGNTPFCTTLTTDCPTDHDVESGGLTDSNHWELQCQ